jgi:hypothetical protein
LCWAVALASQAPVLHLRRVVGGDMVTTYLEETGIQTEVSGLVGIYTDPGQ